MRKQFVAVAILTATVGLTAATLAAIALDAATPDITTETLIERGRYLMKTSGCDDCHPLINLISPQSGLHLDTA